MWQPWMKHLAGIMLRIFELHLQRVSSGAAISIVKGNGSYLASAGFPNFRGKPLQPGKSKFTCDR